MARGVDEVLVIVDGWIFGTRAGGRIELQESGRGGRKALAPSLYSLGIGLQNRVWQKGWEVDIFRFCQ